MMDLQCLLELIPGYNFIFCAFGPRMCVNQDAFKSMTNTASKMTNVNFDGMNGDGNGWKRGVKADWNKKSGNWAMIEFYKTTYDEMTMKSTLTSKYTKPDIIIGLNAGFTMYDDYLHPVIDYIKKSKVMGVFTEWSLQDMGMYAIEEYNFHFDINRIPNPFRSPMIETINKSRTTIIVNSHFAALNVKQK